MSDEEPGRWLAAPTLAEIENAALALRGVGITTPLLDNIEVNEGLSGRLRIKAETAQRIDTFKFLGVYNRIRWMDKAAR